MPVVASVALGVAATTAVFSVLEGVLLTPLPLPNPDRVVRVVGVDRRDALATQLGAVSFGNIRDLGAQASSFTRVVAYHTDGAATVVVDGEPHSVGFATVGEGFHEVLGVTPTLGRAFAADDHRPGAPRVILLTHRGWQRWFGGDRSIVGRSVVVDDSTRTVVGVLPPNAFEFPAGDLAYWVPLAVTESGPMAWQAGRQSLWLQGIARLRPGVTLATAETEARQLYQRFARDHPLESGTHGVRLESLHEHVVGPVRPVLWLLGAAVALVLLIASANVASLLLVEAEDRRREFAVRSALGGTQQRLTAQLYAETGLLTLAGGIAGVLAAPQIVRAFVAMYPGGVPRSAEIGVDARVLVVAALATIVAGLMAGLPLVRRASALVLADDLRDGSRASETKRGKHATALLVVAQVAFSVVLLFGSGLLMRTLIELTQLDPGYRADGVLTFSVTPHRSRHASSTEFYDRLFAELKAIPGVRAVGTVNGLPTIGAGFGMTFTREGYDDGPGRQPSARVQLASPDAFTALGIPIVRGRGFLESDNANAPGVVLVSEALAASAFARVDPVGRRISLMGRDVEIVGVVQDVRRDRSPWEEPKAEVYLPYLQRADRWRYVVVKTDGDPTALAGSVRSVVRRLDPTMAMRDLATMEERVSASRRAERFRAVLVGTLAVLALVLAVIGIYGVVAYAVRRQTRVIGIRMALGETTGAVRRRVVQSALALSAIGVVVGGGGALAFGQSLRGFIHGVPPHDAMTMAAVVVVLLAVTAVAALVPAVRASRVDPVVALRAE
jgi:predicted permease